MAIDFPDSPSVGDQYIASGKTYQWDGTAWTIYGPQTNPDIFKVDTTNNRVGINNTSPTVTLDVTGDVNISGELTSRGYRYVDTLYFTSSGTFTKASYPWLRAVRVKCQGAGGGGANQSTTSRVGGGGAGGTFSESFITDIAGLAASETVTVGTGGAGGAAGGNNAGDDGGDSSFGSLVIAHGGNGSAGTYGGSSSTTPSVGDLQLSGSDGDSGNIGVEQAGGSGGSSHLGGGGRGGRGGAVGVGPQPGNNYGGGGGGSSYGTQGGGDGAGGIVIVELYA